MKIKKNIALSETGFVFNPSTGESFSVNPIGVEIITQLKENKSKEQIKKHIMDKYSTDEASFERDYLDFVTILGHYQILEIENEKEN